MFHVSIGYSVLRPYAERSSFPGQRRTASADLESDREIFSSRPEREITIDSASFPAPEPKEAVSPWREEPQQTGPIWNSANRQPFFVYGVLSKNYQNSNQT